MVVILVLVKKAGDLFLELRHMMRRSHRRRILKKAALDVSRKIVPLQDHRRAKASQDVFFFLGERSLCLLRGVLVRKRSTSLVVPARKLVARSGTVLWTHHHACEYGTTFIAPPMTSLNNA